jgi:hypothetical protein
MTLEMALDAIHSEDLRCRRLAGLLKVHHFAPWQRLRRALPQTGVKRRRESLQKSGPFKKIEELMNVQGIGEQSFLKLKALVAITPAKTAER